MGFSWRRLGHRFAVLGHSGGLDLPPRLESVAEILGRKKGRMPAVPGAVVGR